MKSPQEEEILLPRKGESAAITEKKVKTAALCYDRIWATGQGDSKDEIIPKEVRCFGGTEPELEASAVLKYGTEVITEIFCSEEKNMRSKVARLTKKIPHTKARQALLFFKKYLLFDIDTAIELMMRNISRAFSTKYKIPMIPVFSSKENRDKQYHEGEKEVVIVSLANLNIVDENEITWEQVLGFRADKEDRGKYRRFIHWLNEEMVGKSQAFIEDAIALKLEAYEEAIKKHGIKTIVGTVDKALDSKCLLGASSMAGGLALAGNPTLGILSAGLLIGGKIGVKLIQTKLDFDEVERGPNSEISWVYEVKKLGK